MSWLLLYQIIDWSIRLIMLPVILRRRLMPANALAWLTIIFLIPEIGLVLYLLVGDARLGRKRIKLHRRVIFASRREQRMSRQQRHIIKPRMLPELTPLVLQAESIGDMPILGGNHVELLGDTNAFIDRLIADLDAAKHHVHLLFYIYADDETAQRVSDALIRAAGRGVACRLLVDAAGSRKFLGSAAADELRAAGVAVHAALPVRLPRAFLARIDLRNHRKIAVIDGTIGYTGSHNIVNADYGRHGYRWIDLSGRYTGPIVHQLQIVFMEDWAFDTGQVLGEPAADTNESPAPAAEEAVLPPMKADGNMVAQTVPTGPSEEDVLLPNVLLAAINAAKEKIIITNPYFIPDEPTLLALTMAAHRGVEVELIVPRRSDHWLVDAASKFYYDPLLDAGVRIYRYDGGLLHSKTMSVDDAFALLGSSNLDVRSFHLNFELNVLMYGPQITSELRFAQRAYLADCEEVSRDDWRRRPSWKRYVSSAAALLSPLL